MYRIIKIRYLHNKKKQTEIVIKCHNSRSIPLLAGNKGNPQTFLGHQNFIRLYSEIFPKSVLTLRMAMMNQLICMVYGCEGPSVQFKVHGNHVNANASDSTIFLWFENAHNYGKFRYTCNVLNTRLFDTHCQPKIYLLREMKVEPDLTLVQGESSVRYEWLQSLYIRVTKVNSGYTTECMVFLFLYISKHVTLLVI